MNFSFSPYSRLLLIFGFGVGLPLLNFTIRSVYLSPWLWPLPPGAPQRVFTALLLLLPAVAGTCLFARWIEKTPNTERTWQRLAGPCLALVLSLLAFCLRNVYGPVGDGLSTWVRLADTPFIMGSEPFGHFSHYLAYIALGKPDPRFAVEMAAVAAGFLCFFGSSQLLPEAFPGRSVWLVGLSLAAIPTWLVYAGYLETTPWAYAFTTLYLLSALRYLHLGLRRPPWKEGLLLALAIWTHAAICFASGAHAVLVGYWFFRLPTGRRRWGVRFGMGLISALLVFIPLVASLAWAYCFGSGLSESPWFGNALGGFDRRLFTNPAEISGAGFWTERLNLLWMAYPSLPLVVPAIASGIRARSVETAVLAASLFGCMVLALFWGADLGVYNDFDLLSFLALPAHILVLTWLCEKLGPKELAVSVSSIALANICFGVAPYLGFR